MNIADASHFFEGSYPSSHFLGDLFPSPTTCKLDISFVATVQLRMLSERQMADPGPMPSNVLILIKGDYGFITLDFQCNQRLHKEEGKG